MGDLFGRTFRTAADSSAAVLLGRRRLLEGLLLFIFAQALGWNGASYKEHGWWLLRFLSCKDARRGGAARRLPHNGGCLRLRALGPPYSETGLLLFFGTGTIVASLLLP